MKIGMILDQKFPPDIRVENEALSLTAAGHEVHILCYDFDGKLPKTQNYKGIFLHHINISQNWAKKGRGLINTLFDFYSLFWKKQIISFVKEFDIDVLHVHDLYLLGAALNAKKHHNFPLVADLHENYVDGLKNYRFSTKFPGNIIISQKKWAQKEIEWCNSADHIITVIEEAVERYASLGVDKEKITVVANYVNEEEFMSVVDDTEIISRFNNQFTATYIGAFDLHRGLESLILAVPEIIKEIPNFKLILVGQGRNYSALVNLAEQKGIRKYISFEGFQPQDKLPSYIKASTVCLIPHLKTVHTDNTIPHKLFHYMLLGKPVVSSNCNPIIRIVHGANAGVIYQSGNSKDLSEKIVNVAKDQKKIKQMGENGQRAVKEIYNWGNAAKNLIELYGKIEKQDIRI
jgi:glycosyltransferase involved in cell wall biosynthesis